MKSTKILSKIGLSETESAIYLDLLKNGASNIVEISMRVKFNRPLIYKTIPYLIETGLVSKIVKGKRSHYKAESPEYLKGIFERHSNDFLNLIPDLQEIYETGDKNRPTITVLEGKKSIKFVFEDIVTTLNKGDTYYRYSSRSNFGDFLMLGKYKEIRDKKQINRLVITSEKRAIGRSKKIDRDVVFIPKGFELFDQNVAKMIYANKVAIIDYNTYTSFIIENMILAKFEEKIFKTLFKFLKNMEEDSL
ncbi:MAG: helix-turn-helix domain-containing protein [Candidatus Gracilibacteria bacterium]|nr:helix-turn-helix domain-containing protein [Candidatus Gracilibacteria bacterium]